MIPNVRAFLLDHLHRALGAGANELRFVSGQQPLYVAHDALRAAGEMYISAADVQALHELCLREAQLHELGQMTDASYLTFFQATGLLRCEFKAMGNTRSLSLRRESDEQTPAEQNQKLNSPLSSHAAPAPSEDN